MEMSPILKKGIFGSFFISHSSTATSGTTGALVHCHHLY